MTDALPPFDPPYITFHSDGSNTYCVETLMDGTTRHITMPYAASHLDANRSETKTRKPGHTGSRLIGKPSAEALPLHSALRAALYLNVPFAEKDNAKKLGAKWDAAKRKWYVPNGLDVNLFHQWRSDDLK